ncbi:transcriptional regulator [Zobellella denitrificans]|uniref:Rho-binding antiterminator n=1 Tax=Zobellella denitrificans TaxID=347534 RepID=UPI000B8C255A|nr:Rho-binding antiterminator [Zobellella denitrificans]OXS15605.1 transcriptional regulator [Zobellella denitrificans]
MMSCDQHDYLEIACLYRYRVRLTLASGNQLTGIALDTRRDGDRQECLLLGTDGAEQLVRLAELTRMEALTDNPHFRAVDFD